MKYFKSQDASIPRLRYIVTRRFFVKSVSRVGWVHDRCYDDNDRRTYNIKKLLRYEIKELYREGGFVGYRGWWVE